MVEAASRVLLVEDDALDRSLFRRTLANTRAEIVCVSRLDEALDRLAHEQFELIVSDLNLPDSRYEETYARLKEASRATPVVLITGHEDFVRELGTRSPKPLVFLKSEVHHDIFPLVALGRMLEHLLSPEATAGASEGAD